MPTCVKPSKTTKAFVTSVRFMGRLNQEFTATVSKIDGLPRDIDPIVVEIEGAWRKP